MSNGYKVLLKVMLALCVCVCVCVCVFMCVRARACVRVRAWVLKNKEFVKFCECTKQNIWIFHVFDFLCTFFTSLSWIIGSLPYLY
jgi:hypothetical protein